MTWTNDLPSGNIDQNELDDLLLSWGDMAGSGVSMAEAVPEPATFLVALVFSVVLAVFPNKIGNS